MKTFFAFAATTALALAQSGQANPDTHTCTDGSQLHCCQATFSGGAAPVKMLADLACYDLTPATTNCIITDAPSDANGGCSGEYSCCQVNDLAPALGLFCSNPPGGCTGSEGGDPPHCTDVIDGRFGNCSQDEVQRNRGLLGLGTGILKE